MAELSARLRELGWPIPVAALSRLENGNRRIDVDDLVALAAALGARPSDLLLNDHAETPPFATGTPEDANPRELRAWMNGDLSLTPESRIAFWEKLVEAKTSAINGTIPAARGYAARQLADGTISESMQELMVFMDAEEIEAKKILQEAEAQLELIRANQGNIHDAKSD